MEILSAAPFHAIVEYLESSDKISLAKTSKTCHRFMAAMAGKCWICGGTVYNGKGSSMGCYSCFVCGECCAENATCEGCFLSKCEGCEMAFCECSDAMVCYDCRPMQWCDECNEMICSTCDEWLTCSVCSSAVCDDCNGQTRAFRHCNRCDETHCTACEGYYGDY
jgi:hypothetical protein